MRASILLPSLVFALLVSGISPARAGTDFTPHTAERQEDGLTKQVTYLAITPGQRVLIQPPGGWTLTGGPAGLETHPINLPGCGVTLRSSPFASEIPAFDPKGLELYRRQVLAGIPPGATGVAIVEELPEPLGLFGWKTREFSTIWEFGGQLWQSSTVFVTRGPHEGMVGVAVSPRNAFEPIRTGLFRLLSSWCPDLAN